MIQFHNDMPRSIVDDRRREADEWRLSRKVMKGSRGHARVRPMLRSALLRRRGTAAR